MWVFDILHHGALLTKRLDVFQQVEFALTYNYGYWLMGFLSKEPAEVVRYTSVCRAVEAAGQCVASGISSTSAPVRYLAFVCSVRC